MTAVFQIEGPGALCNTGGPRSRTRRERLAATVLAREGGHLWLPSRRTVGLVFPNEPKDKVLIARRALGRLGYASPEQARFDLAGELPPYRMLAMPWEGRPSLNAYGSADVVGVIVEALILGLSTANLYDPERPVIWTEASLARRLELFDLGGFYEA